MRHTSRLLTLDRAILSFHLNVEHHTPTSPENIKAISHYIDVRKDLFLAATLQVGLNVMLPDGKNINRIKLRYGSMSMHLTTTCSL